MSHIRITSVSRHHRTFITSNNISTFHNSIIYRYHISTKSVSQRYHIIIMSDSHQYHIDITSISQRYHLSITSLSHKYHNNITTNFIRYHITTTTVSNRYHISITTISQLNLSHTTSASLPEAQLIAYYLCAPPGRSTYRILPP